MSTFQFKDPETGKKFELPETLGEGEEQIDLKKLLGHVIAKSKRDSDNENKDKLSTAQAEFSSKLDEQIKIIEGFTSKVAELENQNLSGKERAEKAIADEIKKHKDLSTANEKLANDNYSLFKDSRINNELHKELNKYSLHNRENTLSIIKLLLKPDMENNAQNGFPVSMTGGETPTNVSDGIKGFLEKDENLYLLKNNLKSGSGANNQNSSDTKTSFTKAEMTDSKNRKEFLDRLKAGEDVKITE